MQSNTILASLFSLAGVHLFMYWTTTCSVLQTAITNAPKAAVPAWRPAMRTNKRTTACGVTSAAFALSRVKYHWTTAPATTSCPSAKMNSLVQNQPNTR